MMIMEAFKAYDIRGKWGVDLNTEMVYRIGYFYNQVFQVKSVLVGRDVRLSSEEMFQALCDGLRFAGVDVYDAGITTTPMNYWGNGKYEFDGSIMITASHNPKEYNGLKFSGPNVSPIGYTDGLDRLESLVAGSEPVIPRLQGSLYQKDYSAAYLQFLEQYKQDYSALNLAIDCSNGMAGLFAQQLFGSKVRYLNLQPDGRFPAHEPNPLEAENREEIEKAVAAFSCDAGVIFDGDADRVMFIDEKSRFISPDLIIALLGNYFFGQRHETGRVVQDIRTSKAVAEYLHRYNVEVDIWRVGRAFGATKLKELEGIYGGELAGHYYFRDFYYSDSGLLAALLVLNIVLEAKANGQTFSQLIDEISAYANTGEVNFKIKEKEQAMEAVVDYFNAHEPPEKLLDFDGYRLEFPDWWFNIRPSNTEPYLRFLAEAKSAKLLKKKTEIIYKILKKFK
ncbi:MAG: phosphomannomutase/phosphoglucomutase [Bacteroidales bacterium]|nr:phosphomannomutase/phosphoglucomutase [Bacteroidales bacterium]